MSMSGAPALASYRLALQSPTPGADQAIGLEQRLAHASLRRIEAKEFVFAEGDPATHLYQVETGAVALYKVLCDGRRQVLGFAYPGDLIGLGAQGEHVINAQATKPTRLRCLPLSALSQIAGQDPRLGFRLYEALASELAATRELMLTTGQRSASSRTIVRVRTPIRSAATLRAVAADRAGAVAQVAAAAVVAEAAGNASRRDRQRRAGRAAGE